MIIICPSCGSDKNVQAISVGSEGNLDSKKQRYLRYKSIKAQCAPCLKPLTDDTMTQFMVHVDSSKI